MGSSVVRSHRFSCQTFGPLARGQWGQSNDISSPVTPSHLMPLVGWAPAEASFAGSSRILVGTRGISGDSELR